MGDCEVKALSFLLKLRQASRREDRLTLKDLFGQGFLELTSNLINF